MHTHVHTQSGMSVYLAVLLSMITDTDGSSFSTCHGILFLSLYIYIYDLALNDGSSNAMHVVTSLCGRVLVPRKDLSG